MTISKNFIWFFCLCFAGLLAYAWGLNHPYLFDDAVFLKNNQWLTFEYVWGFFRSFIPISSLSFIGYRPLVLASFTLESHFFHLAPWVVRLDNLILHVFNAWLVFLLVTRALREETSATKRWLPHAVSLVFLLHPVQSNVIFLCWKRSDLLFASGCLASLLCFQTWIESQRSNWRFLIGGFLGLLVSIFSKETALVFPWVALLSHACLWKPRKKTKTMVLLLYAPMMILWSAHAALIFYLQPTLLAQAHFQSQSFMPTTLQLDRWDYLKTQASCLLTYVRLSLLPNNLQVFHDITPVRSWKSFSFLFGSGLTALSLVTAAFSWKKNRKASFFILWFFLFMIPSSSFVPLNMLFDEDRLYLPVLSFCALYVAVFYQLQVLFPVSKKIFEGLFVASLALGFALILARSQDWKSNLNLWSSNALAYPQEPRAWLNLANAYSHAGQSKKADFCFQKSIDIDPTYAAAHYFYGEHLLLNREFVAAEKSFQASIKLGYLLSDAWMNLAAIQDAFHHDDARAREYFSKSLALQPNNQLALRNYATFLEQRNETEQALQLLKRALAYAPWEIPTQLKIIAMLWKDRHDTQNAKKLLAAILKNNPDHPQALALLREIEASAQ